jgi:5'-nucleotidase
VDLSQPAGSRFSNVEIRRKGTTDWLPLADDDVVKVVTNSFIAAGRDGYLTFGTVSAEGRVVDTFIDYAQSFIDYVEQDLGGVVEPLPCDDYSTQLFTAADGNVQLPDPAFPRACE